MKPVDVIVLVICVLVVTTICSPIIASIVNARVVPEQSRELLADLLTSLVAIVSMYVGAKLNTKDK